MQSFRKIFLLLDEKKSHLSVMVCFFALIGLFDLITLYLIQPVIAKFTGSKLDFKAVNFFEKLFDIKLDIFDLLTILIFAFILKFIAALYLNYMIVKFAKIIRPTQE